MSENLTLQLSKIIKTPRSRAFAAWTEPRDLMHWFAPGAMQVESINVDLRVGGTFRWAMMGPSPRTGQDMHIVFTGEYLDVVADQLLRFSWQSEGNPQDRTVVTVAFNDVEGGTEVSLTQERISTAEVYNRNKMGWGSMLDKLVSLCDDSMVHAAEAHI
jgi:uncharacterized protein YndB with AHSA1/START domain